MPPAQYIDAVRFAWCELNRTPFPQSLANRWQGAGDGIAVQPEATEQPAIRRPSQIAAEQRRRAKLLAARVASAEAA
jgi:hypothetical protein